MTIKRVLLLMRSQPNPTPVDAIEAAVALAAKLDAKISTLSCAIRRHVPKGVLSGVVGVVPGLVGHEREEAVGEAQQLLDTFSDLARQRNVMGQAVHRQCFPEDVPNLLAGYARVNDLTIMPMLEGSYFDQLASQWYLEAALFNSGRPLLVLPHAFAPNANGFGTAVVAWDQTKSAARALSDAIPMLRRAASVRVVTITNDKPILNEPPPHEVVLHLEAHGIKAAYEAIDAKGRGAAEVLDHSLRAGDLLVMGGYGHSRLRETVFGGVTKHMLARLPVPVFMSH